MQNDVFIPISTLNVLCLQISEIKTLNHLLAYAILHDDDIMKREIFYWQVTCARVLGLLSNHNMSMNVMDSPKLMLCSTKCSRFGGNMHRNRRM